jgi:uncharacterized membrane protein
MNEQSISRLEIHLGRLLLAGVLVSSLCLALGLILTVVKAHSGDTMLTVGLMLLMATPILRVAVSLVEYVRMRDWFFVATTLFVLAVLAGTVIAALRSRS